MAGDTPSNVTAPRQIQKRKRPANDSSASRLSNKASRTSTPNAYARRTPPRDTAREPSPISDDSDEERQQKRPTQLKRPGAGARVAREATERAEQQRKQREEDEKRRLAEQRTVRGSELVAEHYNAVPERGREWRKTDSAIKGLRSLNNWVKSTLIQKFSRPDVVAPHGVVVLDMACGKGGDLGKWEKAPIVPALYVGCDIAEVSIDQARQRYAETQRKAGGRYRNGGRPPPPQMEAQFYVQDTFGGPLSQINVINQVGFNPNTGPGGVIQGGMMSGGFDVVSMMFALHYSFESEQLARGMLRNVAGALKKGGKFIGVMPNSDVISATVKRLLQAEAPGRTPNGNAGAKSATPKAETSGVASEKGEGDDEDDWDPEKPAEPNGDVVVAEEDGDDWDPEKPIEAPPPTNTNGTANGTADDEEDDWDPEKPSEAVTTTDTPAQIAQPSVTATPAHATSATPLPDADKPPLEWGNSIYQVAFPRLQRPSNAVTPPQPKSLPRDGIFRPPYGWRYNYSLQEAVNVPEYVVPWEGFRALAEEYGLELLYRKGFREVFEDESTDRELGMLAERMGVMSRDRTAGKGGLLVTDEEMEAASFYHAFCFYRT